MDDTKAMRELLGKLVAQIEKVAPYADALYSGNRTTTLIKDRSGVETRSDGDAGVKLRAFDGQAFHERCVQGWQPALLAQETQSLVTHLKDRKLAGKSFAIKHPKEQSTRDYLTAPRRDPRAVSFTEKASRLAAIQEMVLARSDAFVNCQVTYREEEEQRIYVGGARRSASRWTGCTLGITVFVRGVGGEIRHDHLTRFAEGAEVLDIPEAALNTFLERTRKLVSTHRITPGKYTVVLSPNVAGLLAHESFGHGMESDTILHGRARAAEWIGKRIASAKVSICEDPSIPGTHGFLFFDDEGMTPKRTFLIERGIVTQPITESYSAAKKGFSRTANGRAESFDRRVYARMTNTFFLQGKDDPATMVRGIKDGFYLHSASSGMEDPKGWGVQIAGILAERIKNGKRTGEYYAEISIGGFLPDILKSITAIGKDFEIQQDAGFCGKGHKEWVRVSSGGPTLLITGVHLS